MIFGELVCEKPSIVEVNALDESLETRFVKKFVQSGNIASYEPGANFRKHARVGQASEDGAYEVWRDVSLGRAKLQLV